MNLNITIEELVLDGIRLNESEASELGRSLRNELHQLAESFPHVSMGHQSVEMKIENVASPRHATPGQLAHNLADALGAMIGGTK